MKTQEEWEAWRDSLLERAADDVVKAWNEAQIAAQVDLLAPRVEEARS